MAQRPKRRKYKDNPYILNYIEEKNIYIVSFKDVRGHLQKVEISEEVYKAFDDVNVNKEMYKILNLVMYNFVHC